MQEKLKKQLLQLSSANGWSVLRRKPLFNAPFQSGNYIMATNMQVALISPYFEGEWGEQPADYSAVLLSATHQESIEDITFTQGHISEIIDATPLYKEIDCPNCDGSGIVLIEERECYACEGGDKWCTVCGGTGWYDEVECPDCVSDGVIKVEREDRNITDNDINWVDIYGVTMQISTLYRILQFMKGIGKEEITMKKVSDYRLIYQIDELYYIVNIINKYL